MDNFPNRPGMMRNEEVNSAASGGEGVGSAHFPSGVVPVCFIGETQRRSRRLSGLYTEAMPYRGQAKRSS
jgi:hypothetical protein